MTKQRFVFVVMMAAWWLARVNASTFAASAPSKPNNSEDLRIEERGSPTSF
jgi:hypothetical protein